MSDSDIHICSMNGNLDGLNELIAAGGVDINESGRWGWTPLHRASFNGNLEVVNVLVALGAEVNKTNIDGSTPLHYASINGHLEVVNVLVAAGAEVNKTNNNGSTPLHYASRYGRLEVVKALIRAKADVRIENDQGNAPVDIARTNEIRQYIHQHHPWQRRRPLILTRPHDDHATNGDHKLTALGNIVTATRSDKVELFDIKRIIVSFL